MKEIPLGRSGLVAIVDDADYERVSSFKWHPMKKKVNSTFYAVRRPLVNGRRAVVWMHREILTDLPTGLMPDHRNGNGLDNRRENLRPATELQNRQNRRPWTGKRFKGVTRVGDRWVTRVAKKYIGIFGSETEAALAYDIAARQMFGEFARLNFPNGHPQPPVAQHKSTGRQTWAGEKISPYWGGAL